MMSGIEERLRAGEHYIFAGETLRYDLSYSAGFFWLREGPSEPVCYSTLVGAVAVLLLLVGSFTSGESAVRP